MPRQGIVIGEMTTGRDRGKRFMGLTKLKDKGTVRWLLHSTKNPIGLKIRVYVDHENPISLERHSSIPNVVVEKLGDGHSSRL